MKPETSSSETTISILSAAVVSGAMVIGFIFGFSVCYLGRTYTENQGNIPSEFRQEVGGNPAF